MLAQQQLVQHHRDADGVASSGSTDLQWSLDHRGSHAEQGHDHHDATNESCFVAWSSDQSKNLS